ncbi:MAG: saccharopine dehydrogenase NADP-binding domain-containing protein [Flavobacteriales bacterium]|nr:saccharopine dehydrogenase NADP-binding domain-containing protein [Flavobacteriales bacterium]
MPKSILLIGAGRSTTHLIEYLCKQGLENDWNLTIADMDPELAVLKSVFENSKAVQLDINQPEKLDKLVEEHDLVVSMLPAHMHMPVARTCLNFNKHFVSASYLSKEMMDLDPEIKHKDLIFLNECGLDPGLDHISAMSIIDQLKARGCYIREFESFTGGLVAPENDDNAWKYKFTWNPRNVVLSGYGGAIKFMQEGEYKYIPYHQVFSRTEIIEIEQYGMFEGYANRDSLKYIKTYGLEDIKTMYRGTLRRPGFCKAWNAFVALGATDDSYTLENSENMTFREFINTFLAYHPTDSVELKLKYYLNIAQDDVEIWHKLESLDLFKPIKIGLKNATPAQILQHILERKWTMEPNEKDMIVMWHKFVYMENGQRKELHSSIINKGEDQQRTAMSQLVGLPLGMATKLILQDRVPQKGAIMPIYKEIYQPVLEELKTYNIRMIEKTMG